MKGMWTRNQGDHTVTDIDRLSSPPPDTFWAKWFGGVVVPLLLLWPAVHMIVQKEAMYPDRHHAFPLYGTNAILLGCTFLSAALFAHTHYYWGNVKGLIPYHEIGKIIALLGFSISLIWLLIRQFSVL